MKPISMLMALLAAWTIEQYRQHRKAFSISRSLAKGVLYHNRLDMAIPASVYFHITRGRPIKGFKDDIRVELANLPVSA